MLHIKTVIHIAEILTHNIFHIVEDIRSYPLASSQHDRISYFRYESIMEIQILQITDLALNC